MGGSRTFPYVLKIKTVSGAFHTPMEWRLRAQFGIPGYGKPTVANIDKWVTALEDSMKPGGCNAHIGFDPVVEARIVENHAGGDTVAEWVRSVQRPNEPKFQVIQ